MRQKDERRKSMSQSSEIEETQSKTETAYSKIGKSGPRTV